MNLIKDENATMDKSLQVLDAGDAYMVPIGDDFGQTQLVLLNKDSTFAAKLLAHMKKSAADAEATLKKTEKAIK